MMKKLLFILSLVFVVHGFGQNYWTSTQIASKKLDAARVNVVAKQTYGLDIDVFKQILKSAPDRFSKKEGILIFVPNINGKMEQYKVYESSNFEPELQAQFPDIRSYVGIGIDDPTAYLRFSVSPKGIQTVVFRADKQTEFIEPYSTDKTVYAVYNSRNRKKGELPFECKTKDTELITNDKMSKEAYSNTQVYKTFRLALSCTGEYTVYHGGTVADALAAMNATMTRVNGVFEKDFSLHLNIISNNTAVIYTNAATDPYSDADLMDNWNNELGYNLHNTLGDSAFDIGHLFGATGGGGNAGCIGCVCSNDMSVDADGYLYNYKGSGITSPADAIPESDTFDIDYVAHELGHQLGANHTFSFSYEGTSVQVEPGSGSTIMGYAGITDYNVQMHSDDYFAYRSILQVQTNLASKTCSVNTTITNQLPTLSVGASVTIPKGTPFKLTGTATDPEGSSALTYCWEQNNSCTNTTTGDNSICYATKPNGPNFKSIAPVSSGTRYFPQITDVLNGDLYNTWESLLTIGRVLSFTLTVRDINGTSSVTQTATKSVTVSSTIGPFQVTAPTLNQSVATGASLPVTWNVANTTSSPVSVSTVNILLTTDNGATFTTLLSSTANDGSETVTLPIGVSAQNANIIVESVGNVFFAASPKFSIGYTSSTNCNTYTYSGSAISIPDGTGANTYGSVVTSTLNVPSITGNVSSVKVGLNVTHTYISDLVIGIVNPQNTDVYLWGRQCDDEVNMNVTFSDDGAAVTCGTSPISGTILPYEALALMNGNPQAGNWILYAADGYIGDTGTINSWNLQICTTSYTAMSTEEYSFKSFNVFPNPSNGLFNITLQSNNSDKAIIQLFDMSGRLIRQNTLNETQSEINSSVDYSDVSNGLYLMKISKGDESGVKRIVIE